MRMLLRVLAAAVAGLAAGLGFAPFHLVLLLPLAVAMTTLACRGTSLRAGFGLGAVFGSVFMAVLLPWLQVIAVYAWLPLAVVEGLFYALAGLVTAAVVRLWAWPVWTAAAWVAVELARASFPFGGFPWGRLAFAAEDTPLAPLFAYVGAGGVSFAVALLGTTLAWSLTRRRQPVRATVGLAAAVVATGLAAVLPWWQGVPAGSRDVRVAAVQGNVPGVGLEAFDRRRVVLDNHVSATRALARRVARGAAAAPQVVLWPENSSDIDPFSDPSARAQIAGAARAVKAPILMGTAVEDRAGTGWHNRAQVWSSSGRPVGYYDKEHPVPFGEYIPLRSVLEPIVPALRQIPQDMVPGTRPGVLQVGPARVGVLMCFEVAYGDLVDAVVTQGAQMIVVPTNNATYTGTGQVEQQFAISRLRAIETGRYVVVASTNGISGMVAPDGTVVARAPERTRAVLEAGIPQLTALTPAVRLGGWPDRGLTLLAGLATLAGLVLRRRRRGTPGPTPSSRHVETPTPMGQPV